MTVIYSKPTIIITQDGISGNRANAFIDTVELGAATATEKAGIATAQAAVSTGAAADAQASATAAALYDGPRFGTIALMQAGTGFADGKFVRVDQAANGEQEGFVYDAASTLTADGALIVNATGMGVGRLISTRSVFSTVAEMLADNRVLANGTAITAGGYPFVAVASTPHLTLAGGQMVQHVAVGNTFYMLALAPNADGVTDDKAKIDLLNQSGLVLDLGGKSYKYTGVLTQSATIINGQIIDNNRTYDFRISTGETVSTAGQGRGRINYNTTDTLRIDGLPDFLVLGGIRSYGQYLKSKGRRVSTGAGSAGFKTVSATSDQGVLTAAQPSEWNSIWAVANRTESVCRYVLMPFFRCYSVSGLDITLGAGGENKNITPATATYSIGVDALAGTQCMVVTEGGVVSRRMATITANTTTTITLDDATGITQLDFIMPVPPGVDEYHYLGSALRDAADWRNIADGVSEIRARMVNAADCPASGAATAAEVRFGGNIPPLATGVIFSLVSTASTASLGTFGEQVWHDSSSHDIGRVSVAKEAAANKVYEKEFSAPFSKKQSIYLNSTGTLAATNAGRAMLVYGWMEP